MTLVGSQSSLLLSVSDDRTLRLWDSHTAIEGVASPLSSVYGHGARAFRVTYSTELGLVASGAGDGGLCLWGIGQGSKGRALELVYKTELRGCGPIRSLEFVGKDLVRSSFLLQRNERDLSEEIQFVGTQSGSLHSLRFQPLAYSVNIPALLPRATSCERILHFQYATPSIVYFISVPRYDSTFFIHTPLNLTLTQPCSDRLFIASITSQVSVKHSKVEK